MVDRLGNAGDSPGINPADKKQYKAEYKHAADLFQRTLEADQKSTNMYQQDEFNKVMEKSLNVLQETANALKQQKLLEQANQIEKDLAAYQADRSKASADQLRKDLDQAKHG